MIFGHAIWGRADRIELSTCVYNPCRFWLWLLLFEKNGIVVFELTNGSKKQRWSVCSCNASEGYKGTTPVAYVCCLLPQFLGFPAFHGHHQTLFTFSGQFPFFRITLQFPLCNLIYCLLGIEMLPYFLFQQFRFFLLYSSCLSSNLIIMIMLFQVLVFDFQPKDPEDIYVAIAALYGRAVPGKRRRWVYKLIGRNYLVLVYTEAYF